MKPDVGPCCLQYRLPRSISKQEHSRDWQGKGYDSQLHRHDESKTSAYMHTCHTSHC